MPVSGIERSRYPLLMRGSEPKVSRLMRVESITLTDRETGEVLPLTVTCEVSAEDGRGLWCFETTINHEAVTSGEGCFSSERAVDSAIESVICIPDLFDRYRKDC